MSKRRDGKEQPNRFLGTYNLADGRSVVGELRLKGANTLLKLHSDQDFVPILPGANIEGVAYTGERLTLIDCHSPGSGHTYFKGQPLVYHTDVFPHYVAVGRRHLKPDEPVVRAIHFTTTDLATLFYDFDAFGHVIDPKPVIDLVLEETRRTRPVQSGNRPQVMYFSGKDCIAKVSTDIGEVSVHHRPSSNMGGPSGVFIKNRIVVSINPEQAITFDDAINRMHELARFLSMAAGRVQGVEHIYINTTEVTNDAAQPLAIYPTFRWKTRDKDEQREPHPGDVPLDPLRHPAEFEAVLTDWIRRNNGWRLARARYIACQGKAHKYDVDRLVAAANMFDILPTDAVPLAKELSNDVAAAKDASREMFRKLPAGIDRNSALDALGRLGKPSLPKKVAYRVSIIESILGKCFPELQFVANVAVKCRNFFVHGSSADIDYTKVEHLLPFMTDALEFVFAASDFIDAGWDAQRWEASSYSSGHSFTRFRMGYQAALSELRRATSAE
jgi:hypothetical protein